MKIKIWYLVLGLLVTLFSWYLIKNALLKTYYSYEEPARALESQSYRELYLPDIEKLRQEGAPGDQLQDIVVSISEEVKKSYVLHALREDGKYETRQVTSFVSSRLAGFFRFCNSINIIELVKGDMGTSYVEIEYEATDGNSIWIQISGDKLTHLGVYFPLTDTLYSYTDYFDIDGTPRTKDVMIHNFRRGDP